MPLCQGHWRFPGNGRMARKLKTFVTSLGFFDQAIAAPSMKAALEAWGAGSNLFHQGVAKETDDPDVVAATMSKPGVVLKRPAGSSGRFAEHSGLPSDIDLNEAGARRERRRAKPEMRTEGGDSGFRSAARHDARSLPIKSGRCHRIDCCGAGWHRVARIERQHIATDNGRHDRCRAAPLGYDRPRRPSSGW
jgi:hypothetical protein